MTTISYPQQTFFKVGSNISHIRPAGRLVLKADHELVEIIKPRLAAQDARYQTTVNSAQSSTSFWNKAVTPLGKLRALEGSLNAKGGLSKLTVKDFILILNKHINIHQNDPNFTAFLIDCGLAVTEFDTEEKVWQKACELAPNIPANKSSQTQKQRVFAEIIRILTIPIPKPTVPTSQSLASPLPRPR